jgi:type I restriction enzyme S subunit
VRAEWATKPLSEVCQIKPPKAEARNLLPADALVSFVPMEDLGIDQKFLVPVQTRTLAEVSGSYTYFADGDVLLAKITPCFENGKLGIASNLTNGIGFGSSEYIVFRPSPAVDKEWLYYLLSQESFRAEGAERMTGAVGHKRVAKEFIETYPIPVPPLPEQHRIVAILDEAFDGIATAKANAEKNLQNARALFESHLQKVFTERGEGWVERSIGHICTLKSGTSVSVSLEKADGDLPYVKVSDMTYAGNETEIVGSSRYLDMADVGKNAVFPTGTTIFPKRGGAILTNKKRLTTLPICADLNIMGVIPPSNLLPRLLYYYFLNIDMRLLGSGSSIPQINNYDIAPLKISFPVAKEEQKAILQKLDSLAEETQRLESLYRQKLAALDELKKSLLHQAFSGAL